MSYNAQFVSALKKALNGLRTVHTVGEEWCSYIGKIPVGGVPYCGQEVTRSTYSALWSYAQAQGLVKSESEWQSIANAQGGNVPFYSSGDGSSTFRMPRLVGYVRGASDQSEAGSYVKEGLPNITGITNPIGGTRSDVTYGGTGALKMLQSGESGGTGTGSSAFRSQIDFNASYSNPIYGNSSHVTPETSVVLFGVYAFGEIGNVDALDAGTLASAVAAVESNIVELQNKPSPYAYVTETWKSGASWYRKYSDGWVEQGGEVTSNTSSNTAVTFYVPFSTVVYVGASGTDNTADYWSITTVSGGSLTNTGMDVSQRDKNATRLKGLIVWMAEGWI